MAARKNFPLRLDPDVYAALETWAADDLRSVNGLIEFLLREELKKTGRLVKKTTSPREETPG